MGEPSSGVQEMLQRAHELVQEGFDVRAAFGETAGDTVQVFAVRASHHELPWGMQLMAGLFGLTNGATVRLFPGHDSPLAMVVLNINDAQTRKSNIFVQLHDLAMAGDEQSAKLHAIAKDAHRVQAEAAAAGGARRALRRRLRQTRRVRMQMVAGPGAGCRKQPVQAAQHGRALLRD